LISKSYQWTGLKSIIKIHAQVHDKSKGKDTEETRWYQFFGAKRGAIITRSAESLAS